MATYFVFIVLFAAAFGSSDDDQHNSVKDLIIREIMKKVSNLTLNSLSNVPVEKKDIVLEKIENKLKVSANGLVDGNKYVKFIMEEFNNKAYAKQENVTKEIETNPKNVEHNNLRSSKEKRRKILNTRTKEEVVNDIANKIETMAKIYLKETQTLEEKKNILHKIERRILESSKRKHMQIHKEHNALKAYTELITKGLEVCMEKLLKFNSRRMGDTKLTKTDMKNDTTEDDEMLSNLDQIHQYKKFFSELWNETSIDPHCDQIVDEICLSIKSLHELPCGDGKIISLDQLCDGVFDCWTLADETNCKSQAVGKIHRAIELMTEVDESIAKKCLKPIVATDSDTLSNHHLVLRGMLKSQMHLIEIYPSPQPPSDDQDTGYDSSLMKKVVEDVSKLVTALSYSLGGILCLPQDGNKTVSNISRRNLQSKTDEYKKFGEEIHNIEWLPKSCICKFQYCKLDNCDPRCKRVCWQKYSLNHWACQSLSGDTSISLDLICDGKIDCFDESDEISCKRDSSIAKFNANTVYDNLIQLLSLKSLSVEYDKSRNVIIAQIGLVRQIKKLSTKSNVDIHAVKLLRNQYFKTLVNMYKGMLGSSNLTALDNSYEYLLLLNNKLLQAMRLSHTGNEIVISPSGCYCKKGTCALMRCSPKCIATCSVEHIFTKYSCNNSDLFINLKAVCNGKKDCPNGDDEKDCSKEACRGHHLVMLRHNLQKAGTSPRGTVLGEVLNDWKTKVTASLIIAERKERPNHRMVEDVISGVLKDLVTAYASTVNFRKSSSDLILKEFRNMSNIVKRTLKLCRN